MDLEKYEKFIRSLEWNEGKGDQNPLTFDSLMILFTDGEFMIQPSDSIRPDELQSNKNVFSFTYVNENNRIDCLHMAILFIIMNETDKSTDSFLSFRFTYNEFFEMYKSLGFDVSLDEKTDSTKVIYKVIVPSKGPYNTVSFTQESVVKATCMMLSIYYKGGTTT